MADAFTRMRPVFGSNPNGGFFRTHTFMGLHPSGSNSGYTPPPDPTKANTFARARPVFGSNPAGGFFRTTTFMGLHQGSSWNPGPTVVSYSPFHRRPIDQQGWGYYYIDHRKYTVPPITVISVVSFSPFHRRPTDVQPWSYPYLRRRVYTAGSITTYSLSFSPFYRRPVDSDIWRLEYIHHRDYSPPIPQYGFSRHRDPILPMASIIQGYQLRRRRFSPTLRINRPWLFTVT